MPDDVTKDTQNYSGFFVAMDDCVFCGCCHIDAPDSFRWTSMQYTDSRGELKNSQSSEIHKQPETEDELGKIVSAIGVCISECIRYGGTDPKVIEFLLGRDVPLFSIVHLNKVDLKSE